MIRTLTRTASAARIGPQRDRCAISRVRRLFVVRTVVLATKVDRLTDDVERSALDLLVDAADVLAEDADHQKLHAREERDDDDDGRPSLDRLPERIFGE